MPENNTVLIARSSEKLEISHQETEERNIREFARRQQCENNKPIYC